VTGFKVGCKTDVGKVRKENEDCRLVLEAPETSPFKGALLALVADGMGGHSAGEVASRIACETLNTFFEELLPSSPEAAKDHLVALIRKANDAIAAYGAGHLEAAGLGTTLTALLFLKDSTLLAHVGDSRIYHLRGDCLVPLTRDHTEVRVLLDLGHITPEEARRHPRRHILIQALGLETEDTLMVETRAIDREPGDAFLLTTDGVHDQVEESAIRQTLQESDPQAAADRLVALANEAGGQDNATAIVIRVPAVASQG
jgi:protein phosphatase